MLTVVLPPAVLVLAGLLWQLHRRRALTPPRILVAVVVAVYVAGIVANTVLPIRLGDHSSPPWRVYLHLTPLAGTDLADMRDNVLVFAPLGVLLPLVARVRTAGRAALLGFAVSLTMESLQLLNAVSGHGGHVADVNDLLANTVGALVGYAAFRAALRLAPAERLARAATWPPGSVEAWSRRVRCWSTTASRTARSPRR